MDRIPATAAASAACPFMHVEAARLAPGDELVLEMPKRIVLQYLTEDDGARVLALFYGGQEITFDEPHLFAFGETLAKQSRFTAAEAISWGEGLDWSEVSSCLEALLDAGVLIRAEEASRRAAPTADRSRPSPLGVAEAKTPASWSDLESITQRLAGRAVEQGWLELVIPVFRIAHMALDADDRQVGEANVFPRALRLDRPTEWMACTYAGTRYLDPKPMNVTALKSMRAHWTEMMMAIAAIRDAYLARHPNLPRPLDVGAVERLATLVLALPTWQLVRPHNRVANGTLHPALSSLFRVTDGVRLVMHQMMFVPAGEATLPADTPVSVDGILDYAERNFAFHSETGVCAGPRHFVRDFLEVLVEGKTPRAPADFAFSPEVSAALAEMDQAFDYGLAALRAHAAVFAFWPAMARCYERMAKAVGGVPTLAAPFQDHLVTMERSTYLGSESLRRDREAAYARIFEGCAEGLGEEHARLDTLLAAARLPEDGLLEAELTRIIAASHDIDQQPITDLAAAIATFARDTQSLLAVAAQCQAQINAMLGRPAPQRPFTAEDINVHVRLQGEQPGKRLPFLLDELKLRLGVVLDIGAGHIQSSAAVDPPRS